MPGELFPLACLLCALCSRPGLLWGGSGTFVLARGKKKKSTGHAEQPCLLVANATSWWGCWDEAGKDQSVGGPGCSWRLGPSLAWSLPSTCLVSPALGTRRWLCCPPEIRAGAAAAQCARTGEGGRTSNLLRSWSIPSRKPCNLLKGLRGGRARDLFPPLNKNDGKREGQRRGRRALGVGTGLCKDTALRGERQSHGCCKAGEFGDFLIAWILLATKSRCS